MNTAHRIIDRWTNQTKRYDWRFTHICLPPNECAQSLNYQSARPRKRSAWASSASEINRALLTAQRTGESRSRNVRSTNARHPRIDTCTAAKPRPPP